MEVQFETRRQIDSSRRARVAAAFGAILVDATSSHREAVVSWRGISYHRWRACLNAIDHFMVYAQRQARVKRAESIVLLCFLLRWCRHARRPRRRPRKGGE